MVHVIPMKINQNKLGARYPLKMFLLSSFMLLSFTTQAASLSQVEAADASMRSRVCGLVLLSDGRADARLAKSSKDDRLTAQSFNKLTRAFALLADGREANKGAARSASADLLGTLNNPGVEKQAALTRCNAWLTWRTGQVNFDKSETARFSWAQQAKLTFDSE